MKNEPQEGGRLTETMTRRCVVDHAAKEMVEGVLLRELETGLQQAILTDFPVSQDDAFICFDHLLPYRLDRINTMRQENHKASRHMNNKLTHILTDKNFKVINVKKHQRANYTFGQRVADNVAQFGGSWGFIIIAIVTMVVWIVVNGLHLFHVNFDPYPFILLNLFLSMTAALQAPLILMSQNRSSDYDRMHADNDFHVNLKTEEEMRVLHAKIDHLIQKDNPDLLEVQVLQTKMLGEVQQQLSALIEQQTKQSE